MIDVSQDKFVTDFVTTFLATWSAGQYNHLGEDAWNLVPPVKQAIWSARRAWVGLLEHGMVRL